MRMKIKILTLSFISDIIGDFVLARFAKVSRKFDPYKIVPLSLIFLVDRRSSATYPTDSDVCIKCNLARGWMGVLQLILVFKFMPFVKCSVYVQFIYVRRGT